MSATVVMCEWSPEIAGSQRNPQSVSSVAASPNHDFISETKYAGYSDQNPAPRSEEHTSELQSQSNLVCRLLLEKKNTYTHRPFVRHNILRPSQTICYTRRHCTERSCGLSLSTVS